MRIDRPGAVIVGAHVNGLTVARALWAAGIPVVMLRTRAWDIAHVSRAVSQAIDLRAFPARPEALVELLEAQREAWRGFAVYPTDDLALDILLRRGEALRAAGYRLITPPEPAARALLDKSETHRLARKLGVPVPVDYGEAQSAAIDPKRLRYPVVLKPHESHRFREAFPGKKLFEARNAVELEAARRRLAQAGLRAQTLDYIPGPDSLFFNYSVYVTSAGEPLAGFAMRKDRKTPPFHGVCRVAHAQVEPRRSETMREAVAAMLAEIGYRGMANAEFKLDERDGVLRLMEINARPFLMQGLPLRAGLSYARMAWQDVALGERPVACDNGWRGSWVHLHADIGNAVVHRKLENLRLADYLRPYRRRVTFAVLSARDPAPFALQWSGTLRRALAGAIR